jgi:hypothetical protein
MVIKAVLCSIVLILLSGPGVFGAIIQDQIFNVGSANLVNLTQGTQSGHSTQNLVIDLSQVTDGSQLAATNVQVSGLVGGGSSLLGSSSLLGVSSLGTHALLTPSLLGTSMLTSHTSTSLLAAQTRARLLGLGLTGF